MASPPADSMVAWVSLAAASFTSMRPTRAPSPASLIAAARPMPSPAPETTARLPSNRPLIASIPHVREALDLDHHSGDLVEVGPDGGAGGVGLGEPFLVGGVVSGEQVRVDEVHGDLDDVRQRGPLGPEDRLHVVDGDVGLLLDGVALDLAVR